MTSTPRVILIHGNGGATAADGWLPFVERDSALLGLEVVNCTFPDNVRARASVWLRFLETLGADDNTVLIGHSSGAVAAMRYAETHRLLGSVLVGVCHTDLGDAGERASGYYRDPWRWSDIRRHQQWIGSFTRPTIRSSRWLRPGSWPVNSAAVTSSTATAATSSNGRRFPNSCSSCDAG